MGYTRLIEGSLGTAKETWKVGGTGEYRLPNVIEALEIENTHGSQDIYVSFNGGRTKRTILFGEVWSIDTYSDRLKKGQESEVTLWASGASTTFEMTLIISEPE